MNAPVTKPSSGGQSRVRVKKKLPALRTDQKGLESSSRVTDELFSGFIGSMIDVVSSRLNGPYAGVSI